MRLSDAENEVMPFGKYRGRTLADINHDDPAYLRWLAEDADIQSPRLREAVDCIYNAQVEEGADDEDREKTS